MPFNLDDFYDGNETKPFRFYRIPKTLFNEELSLEAVTLYGLMLDRVGLSIRNGWADEQGRAYIYFVQTDVQKRLRCGHNRATTIMRELEDFGLIERKRQGLGKPAKIYVKNFAVSEMADGAYPETAQKDTADRNQKSVFPSVQNGVPAGTQRSGSSGERRKEWSGRSPRRQAGTEQSGISSDDKAAPVGQSRVPEAGSLDCPNQAANDTEKKETELIETNHILPRAVENCAPLRPAPPDIHSAPFPPAFPTRTACLRPKSRRAAAVGLRHAPAGAVLGSSGRPGRFMMDEMRWVREEIRENIDYEGLLLDRPCDQDIVDGYVELMTEAACSPKETFHICGQELPTAVVRNRFLKLERDHIEYVRDCLCNTTRAIGNIKAYTLAALYNAPVTMEQYYAALVSRDFTL